MKAARQIRLGAIFFLGLLVVLVGCFPAGAGGGGGSPAEATIETVSLSLPTQDFRSILTQFPPSDYRYPYHQVSNPGTQIFQSVAWEAVVLENVYLRVTAVPSLGGRILKLENLTTGSNEFFENPHGIKLNGWGRFAWWSATGGVEFMLPYDEHGGMFYTDYAHASNPDPGRGYRTEDRADGVALIMAFSESSALGLTRWRHEIELFLPDAAAFLRVGQRVVNQDGAAHDLMYWSNAMISPGPGNMRHAAAATLNHRVIFDKRVDSLYNHNDNAGESFWGNPWDTLSWPVHGGSLHGGGIQSLDISLISNWYTYDLKYAGLFAPSSVRTAYLGQYNLTADEGVVKLYPEEILPGTATGSKYWHWGSFSASASPSFADGGATYAEIMTGAATVFQEPADEPPTAHPTGETYMVSVAGGGELAWDEYYLAPQGIGDCEYADGEAAVSLAAEVEGAGYRVTLGLYPLREVRNATVKIFDQGTPILVENGVDFGPGDSPGPLYRSFSVAGLSDPAALSLSVASDGWSYAYSD